MKKGFFLWLVLGTNVVTAFIVYSVFDVDRRIGARSSVIDGSRGGRTEAVLLEATDPGATVEALENVSFDVWENELEASKNSRSYYYLADRYADELDLEGAIRAIGDWHVHKDSRKAPIVLRSLYRRWAEFEPLEAVRAAMTYPWKTQRFGDSSGSQVIASAFKELALQDSETALEMLNNELGERLVNGPMFGSMSFREIGQELFAGNHFDAVDAWMNGFNSSSVENMDRLKNSFMHGIGESMGELSFGEAKAFAERYFGEDAPKGIYGTFVREKAKSEPLRTAEWVMGLGENQSKLLGYVVAEWAYGDGGTEAAMEFLASTPESIDVDPSLRELFRAVPLDEYDTRLDIIGLVEDSRSRDSLAAEFVYRSKDLDPESRLDVALTINRKQSRDSAMIRLYREWGKTDPGASIQSLDALVGFDDSEIEKLRETIDSVRPKPEE